MLPSLGSGVDGAVGVYGTDCRTPGSLRIVGSVRVRSQGAGRVVVVGGGEGVVGRGALVDAGGLVGAVAIARGFARSNGSEVVGGTKLLCVLVVGETMKTGGSSTWT